MSTVMEEHRCHCSARFNHLETATIFNLSVGYISAGVAERKFEDYKLFHNRLMRMQSIASLDNPYEFTWYLYVHYKDMASLNQWYDFVKKLGNRLALRESM